VLKAWEVREVVFFSDYDQALILEGRTITPKKSLRS